MARGLAGSPGCGCLAAGGRGDIGRAPPDPHLRRSYTPSIIVIRVAHIADVSGHKPYLRDRLLKFGSWVFDFDSGLELGVMKCCSGENGLDEQGTSVSGCRRRDDDDVELKQPVRTSDGRSGLSISLASRSSRPA